MFHVMSVCHSRINVFNKQHSSTLYIHLILKCLHCFPQELDTFFIPLRLHTKGENCSDKIRRYWEKCFACYKKCIECVLKYR